MSSDQSLNRYTTYLFLIVLVVVVGCAPVYVPNARHTHQLSEKGEIAAGGYAGTNGSDVQLAYAVSDDFGVLAAGSFIQNTESDFHKHKYGEFALQFQEAFNTGRFEVMTGYGFGTTTTDGYTGNYGKFFLQPNFGLETNFIDAGFAL